MKKIGLTGGIGTGKSTVSSIFQSKGFTIIDADIIARDVLVKYPQILKSVRETFGSGYFDWKGQFKRAEFSNHMFKFPKLRVKYEEMIMPYIMKEINNSIKKYEKEGKDLVILDAPTLIENNFEKEMDYVILVIADTNTQISRIKARNRMTSADAVRRINAQMSLEEKKSYADIIIDNNGDLESTKIQLDQLTEFLKVI